MKHFASIYAVHNAEQGLDVQNAVARCLSAVVDVQDAIKRLPTLEVLNQIDILHSELADLYAWLFTVVNLYDSNWNLEQHFLQLFTNACYTCNNEPCKCPEIDQEVKVAKYRVIGA